MLKIRKEKINRPITEHEFNILKETEPFKSLRKNAKQCFPKSSDTEVLTERGYLPLAHIIDMSKEDRDKLRVIGRDGNPKNINKAIHDYNHYIMEFDLDNGDKFRCSWSHLCPVIREGKEILVTAIEVEPTDLFLEF